MRGDNIYITTKLLTKYVVRIARHSPNSYHSPNTRVLTTFRNHLTDRYFRFECYHFPFKTSLKTTIFCQKQPHFGTKNQEVSRKRSTSLLTRNYHSLVSGLTRPSKQGRFYPKSSPNCPHYTLECINCITQF